MRVRIVDKDKKWARRICVMRGHVWKTLWAGGDHTETYDTVQCRRCEEIRWRTRQ